MLIPFILLLLLLLPLQLIYVVHSESTGTCNNTTSSNVENKPQSSSHFSNVCNNNHDMDTKNWTIPRTVTLHNGVEMPLLQLGTAQLITKTGIDPTVPDQFIGMIPERSYRQIELALQYGIRAFDTAYIYRTHVPIGYVLGEWYRTGKLQHRNQIWIQTKIFHPNATHVTFGISHMSHLSQMTPQEVSQLTLQHFETSLLQLNVGYVDLILLHWPSSVPDNHTNISNDNVTNQTIDWSQNNEYNNRQRRIAAWKVLEQVYEKGWARAIGVSNFSVKHLQQLIIDGAMIVPMVNQIEASVTLQYSDIVQYCLKNHIVPQAYSPFGRGLTEMPKDILQSMVTSYHKQDIGQIAIRYLLQLGYSVIFLSNSPDRMISNMDVFDFNISQSDMYILQQQHRHDGGWGLPSPNELE